jgi:prepilin-type processing-associated H-X9-DG protein
MDIPIKRKTTAAPSTQALPFSTSSKGNNPHRRPVFRPRTTNATNTTTTAATQIVCVLLSLSLSFSCIHFLIGSSSIDYLPSSLQYFTATLKSETEQTHSITRQSWLERRENIGQKMQQQQSDQDDHFWSFAECKDVNHTVPILKHGCKFNKQTSMVHCAFNNFRVNVAKIQSDRGGETLDSRGVLGRPEEPEFPIYKKGAFSTLTTPHPMPKAEFTKRESFHYLNDVLEALNYPFPPKDWHCAETWPGTTMFITRYEYVNLYHTMTDWWNTYFSLPPESERPVNIVFLDGHAKGNLDAPWEKMFGKVTYVQHLKKGGVCFERAVMIPPGYAAPIFHQVLRPQCPVQDLADQFASHVLASYNLQDAKKIPGRIVIIDRVPYMAHPRSKPKEAQRILQNLDALKSRLAKVKGVTSVAVVRLEKMDFGTQLKTMRQAHILIGNHGAGLTHVLFMDKNSHLMEFAQDYMEFFQYLSEWKGISHKFFDQQYDSRLEENSIQSVVSEVTSILRGGRGGGGVDHKSAKATNTWLPFY